ncbi:MAG: DUF6798 domain-containing protein [Gemmataceae bacterium]
MSHRREIYVLLLGALAFAVAYGQAPLYYSNQHQYFLHGLARAGHGDLDRDWLANTLDPTPLFTALVATTYRFLPARAFHIYYALLQVIYVFALYGVFAYLAGERKTPGRQLAFLAGMSVIHSAFLRWLSFRVLDWDYPWYFQAGVAGQYVLGSIFQPSTFGVLLIVAVVLGTWDRPFLAVISACLAAILHTTYLLGAALLTAAVQCVLWTQGRHRQAILAGLLGLLLAAPVVAFVALTFAPTTPKTFTAAQDILVRIRIPHHAIVARWLDLIAGLQILWIVLAIFLARGTRLAPLLAIPLVLGGLLTLIQLATGSATLALLFPWRFSAVLVPVATAVVATRLVLLGGRWLDSWQASVACVAVMGSLALAGSAMVYWRLGYPTNDRELPLLDYVHAHKQPGDVYLIPVRIPDLARGPRGSLSSDFRPPQDDQLQKRLIPPDLQRFRLYTGAPLYVDFKSIPYQDVEVLEWENRLRWAERMYQGMHSQRWDMVEAELRDRGISHVVIPAQLSWPGREPVFADDLYQVISLRDEIE